MEPSAHISKNSLGIDKVILFVVLSFLFAGCANKIPRLPDALASTKTASAWHVSEYQLLSSLLFDSDQHAETQQYVKQVLDNNPDLKSIAATAKAVEYELNIAKADARPQADLRLSGTRSKDALTKEIGNTTSLSLDVNWTLDLWGKLADEARAAQHMADKSQHDLTQIKRLLIVQAVQLWIEYWGYDRLESKLTQLANTNSHLLGHYQDSYKVGLASYEFILDARNREKNSQTRVWELQLDKQKLLHLMNTLRGHFPVDALDVNNGNIPAALVMFDGEIPAATLANRSDIQVAFAEVLAFEEIANAAHKALLPHINLSASVLKSGTSFAKAMSGELVWQLIGGLTQPLFNSDQLKAFAKRKSAEAESSWWRYQHVVLEAMREVEDAMASDRQLGRQLTQKRTALGDLEQQTRSAEERFSDGELPLSDYFLIKAEYTETQIELTHIEVLYIKNRLAMVVALGLPIELLWEMNNEKS